jgi:hypothetical protein
MGLAVSFSMKYLGVIRIANYAVCAHRGISLTRLGVCSAAGM